MYDNLIFNVNRTLLILKVKEILYFEKDKKLIKIIQKNNKNFYIKISVKRLVSILEYYIVYQYKV